jgi:hypothetical protein
VIEIVFPSYCLLFVFLFLSCFIQYRYVDNQKEDKNMRAVSHVFPSLYSSHLSFLSVLFSLYRLQAADTSFRLTC